MFDLVADILYTTVNQTTEEYTANLEEYAAKRTKAD